MKKELMNAINDIEKYNLVSYPEFLITFQAFVDLFKDCTIDEIKVYSVLLQKAFKKKKKNRIVKNLRMGKE